jgi:hypothetical protein
MKEQESCTTSMQSLSQPYKHHNGELDLDLRKQGYMMRESGMQLP